MGNWGTCPPCTPSTSNNFVFGSLWSRLSANYPNTVQSVRSASQQLTALSISTALVTKLLVIEQLLHPALKFAVSAPWPNFQHCPSSQQILATPLHTKAAWCILSHICVCPPVCHAPIFESLDLESSFLICRYIFKISTSSSYIESSDQCQGHKSKTAHLCVELMGGRPSIEMQSCLCDYQYIKPGNHFYIKFQLPLLLKDIIMYVCC